jgi:hypothetical protein
MALSGSAQAADYTRTFAVFPFDGGAATEGVL